MARPRKRRRVCCVPSEVLYGPINQDIDCNSIIILTVEEYEVIRLMDLLKLTQEECSQRMNVSRTSIQRLYDEARFKLADSFINKKAIKIEGGDYIVCNGENIDCCGKNCTKKRHL